MQIYFAVNVERKFRDSSWCSLNRGCSLNMGSTYYGFHCRTVQASLIVFIKNWIIG